VTRYGMSDTLGPRTFGARDELVFLGRRISEQRNYGEQVARQIDEEINKIIEIAYSKAKEILSAYRDQLDTLANRLILAESVYGDELARLIERPKLAQMPALVAAPV